MLNYTEYLDQKTAEYLAECKPKTINPEGDYNCEYCTSADCEIRKAVHC